MIRVCLLPFAVIARCLAAGPAFCADAAGPSTGVAAAADDTAGDTPAPALPLSGGLFHRLFDYYKLEWGQSGPPADPAAPASRRSDFAPQPETIPPMPFTEWPYGGATGIGVNRPASVDSPLMQALAPSDFGKALARGNMQIYGWVDVGGNISTSKVKDGNSPAADDDDPNTLNLDQVVLYWERTPDTVQRDHADWGFRASVNYGTDYRYTTSYGIASYQLLRKNKLMGYDFPMVYLDGYFPKIAKGLLIRIGRYISIPDIEAQLAPNTYMYSHSLGYSQDNYSNTGILATLAATDNLFVQLGVSIGTDTAPWNLGRHETNLMPMVIIAGTRVANPLYPGATFLKDPGAKPALAACLRYQNDSARDNVYLCADAINNGQWGYNNLQWYGFTYFHKFTDKWHLSSEFYTIHQNNVPNLDYRDRTGARVVQQLIAGGGTPFSPQYIPFNAPNAAQCNTTAALRCTAISQMALVFVNYQPRALDNVTARFEFFNDKQGQRTGVRTRYVETAIGLQHWLSPQIELRPEVALYKSLDAAAFNGNADLGIAPSKSTEFVAAGDVIWHF